MLRIKIVYPNLLGKKGYVVVVVEDQDEYTT